MGVKSLAGSSPVLGTCLRILRDADGAAARPPLPSRMAGQTTKKRRAGAGRKPVEIPEDQDHVELVIDGKPLKLTNLRKVFWPELGLNKGDLLRYYRDVAHVLLPHLRDRAMVMKRYPDGAAGKFFFMKRVPPRRPDWLETCAIPHAEDDTIMAPVVNDLASLLWVVNLGCIDLNPWYGKCDDPRKPDSMNFDLDPVKGNKPVPFAKVLDAALAVRDGLQAIGIQGYAKTTGSRGIHVSVPIRRGPDQEEVWRVAKGFALVLGRQHPKLLTTVYAVAKRPPGTVLVDYNQNAWGRTLASAYSVRPTPRATVSAPVKWSEIERGIRMEDFRIDTMPRRIARVGDLLSPMLNEKKRVDLSALLK